MRTGAHDRTSRVFHPVPDHRWSADRRQLRTTRNPSARRHGLRSPERWRVTGRSDPGDVPPATADRHVVKAIAPGGVGSGTPRPDPPEPSSTGADRSRTDAVARCRTFAARNPSISSPGLVNASGAGRSSIRTGGSPEGSLPGVHDSWLDIPARRLCKRRDPVVFYEIRSVV